MIALNIAVTGITDSKTTKYEIKSPKSQPWRSNACKQQALVGKLFPGFPETRNAIRHSRPFPAHQNAVKWALRKFLKTLNRYTYRCSICFGSCFLAVGWTTWIYGGEEKEKFRKNFPPLEEKYIVKPLDCREIVKKTSKTFRISKD